MSARLVTTTSTQGLPTTFKKKKKLMFTVMSINKFFFGGGGSGDEMERGRQRGVTSTTRNACSVNRLAEVQQHFQHESLIN